MKPLTPVLTGLTGLLCALLLASPASAQYKVVGPDGRVTYTDVPQAGATGSRPNVGPSGGSTALPAELRQAAGRYPVTLYASKDCSPCDAGRQLLQQRGVPYTEKRIDSRADGQALQRLAGSTTLPLLTVGSQQVKGLSASQWHSYLDAAGYPRESRLPANWRAAEPTPLAPAVEPATAAPANDTPSTSGDSSSNPAQPKIRF